MCLGQKAVGCCAGTTLTFNITNQYNTYRFGGEKVSCPALPMIRIELRWLNWAL